MEAPMRTFIVAAVAAAVLATTAAYTLSAFQETVAQATTTESVRLDQQEAVNFYGREADPS
jgi:archaellin